MGLSSYTVMVDFFFFFMWGAGDWTQVSRLHGLELYPQLTHNYFLTVERTPAGAFLKRQAQRHLEAGLGLGQWGLSKGQFWEGNKGGKLERHCAASGGLDTVCGGLDTVCGRVHHSSCLPRSRCGTRAVQPCLSQALVLCRYYPQGGANSCPSLSIWPKDFSEALSS